MFIHTHYHDRSLSVIYNQNPDRGSQTVSILPCDCLDDFFIPLNAVEEIRICVPTTQLKSELIIQSQTNHNTPFTILHQLRGPPDLL